MLRTICHDFGAIVKNVNIHLTSLCSNLNKYFDIYLQPLSSRLAANTYATNATFDLKVSGKKKKVYLISPDN